MTKLNTNFIFKRWPIGCLLLLLVSCYSKNETLVPVTKNSADTLIEHKKTELAIEKIKKSIPLVKSGDLVLRTGRDFTSDLMRRLSQQDKSFSHCGIASWESDTLFVYHAIGGEWNPDQKIRRDRYSFFCNPYENKGFGIFRYPLNLKQKQKLLETVRHYFKKQIMFDNQFDLESDDRMYCSEFVFKSLQNTASPGLELKTTIFDDIEFVAIDNLFINAACQEIKRIKF